MGLQTGANLGGKEQRIRHLLDLEALDARKATGVTLLQAPLAARVRANSCKIALRLKEGTEYRLRLWEIADARKPTEPRVVGAWLMDMSTKQETIIGQIQVPADWKWMTSSTNFFVEYY